MEDAEYQFLRAMGITQQQLGRVPDFMVRTEAGKVRIALRSKLEAVFTFGNWAVVTVSPQDFVAMTRNFQAVLSDLQKQERQQPRG